MHRTNLDVALEQEIPHLYRYAQSLTHDPVASEDLVQDCLLRAVSRADQFEQGSHLRRWLFTILRNVNIDQRRRIARRGDHVPLEDWYAETHQPATQEMHLAVRDVSRKIAALRPCDRTILYLSVFQGLDHERIASQLNVAVGTVKSRLSRARRKLAA
jgi:RNA polymerase sigma-70 factor (ECF subfamily)